MDIDPIFWGGSVVGVEAGLPLGGEGFDFL